MAITFILLAANEDANYLRGSLQCLIDGMQFGDRLMVVVDDGYNYRFDNVFRQFQITPLNHKLNNDFAAHRNWCLDRVETEYAFFLDCDEWISWRHLQHLHSIINNNDVDAVEFIRINPMVPGKAPMPDNIDMYSFQNFPDKQVRLFRSKYRYSGKLHEGIVINKERILSTNVPIIHVKDTDRALQQHLYYETLK